eukprot:scaffold83399_cov41-Phaeocystis_antarctica.AAC.1
MQEQVVPFAVPRVRAAGRPVRDHRPGNAPFSSGVMDPPRRDRQPCLSPTLGPHDEDTACLEKMRRRSRGVLVTEGFKTNDLEKQGSGRRKTTRRNHARA